MKNFIMTVLLLSSPVENECRKLLDQARCHVFNEEYARAYEAVVAVRKLSPQNAESYEITTLTTLFRLKKELGISGVNPISDTRRLKEHAAAIEQFMNEIDEGLRLTREQLRQNPGDEHALFLAGKLHLNKLVLTLQVLNKKSGRKEYVEARRIMDGILLTNPNHCRALVVSGWMNYIIGTRGFFERLGLAVFGIYGGKEKGIKEIVHAADPVIACEALDKVEARFSLLEILKREQQWPQMYAIAKELGSRFSENTQLKKYMELAARQTGVAR